MHTFSEFNYKLCRNTEGFRFLNKRVKINICKLQVQIEHFDKVVQFQLHRLILKELIGSNGEFRGYQKTINIFLNTEDRIREFTGMFDLSYYGWDLKAERIARHCIRFGMQEGVDLHGSQLLNFDVFEVAEPLVFWFIFFTALIFQVI